MATSGASSNSTSVKRGLQYNITHAWPMTMKPSISAIFSASVLAFATCSTVYVMREINDPAASR